VTEKPATEKPATPKPPAPKATEMENTTKLPKLVEGVDKPAEYHQAPGTPKPNQG
jgi:hypothetical protein